MQPKRTIGFLILFWIVGIAWHEMARVSTPEWLNWILVVIACLITGLCAVLAFRWCERAYDQGYTAGIAAEKAKQNQYVEQMQEPPNDGDLLG